MIHLVNETATPEEIHEVATHLANTVGELDYVGLLMNQSERDVLDRIQDRLQQALRQQALAQPVASPKLKHLLDRIKSGSEQ
jgi:hypothetical protein